MLKKEHAMVAEKKDRQVIDYAGSYEMVGESSHVVSSGWTVVFRGGGAFRVDYSGSKQECAEWLQDRGHTVIRMP